MSIKKYRVKVKSRSEIRSLTLFTKIFWNEFDMQKFCGGIYEMEKSSYMGEPIWVMYENSSAKWMFADNWVIPIEHLEKELFEI